MQVYWAKLKWDKLIIMMMHPVAPHLSLFFSFKSVLSEGAENLDLKIRILIEKNPWISMTSNQQRFHFNKIFIFSEIFVSHFKIMMRKIVLMTATMMMRKIIYGDDNDDSILFSSCIIFFFLPVGSCFMLLNVIQTRVSVFKVLSRSTRTCSQYCICQLHE